LPRVGVYLITGSDRGSRLPRWRVTRESTFSSIVVEVEIW
jgi:hypothetical protein